MSIDAPILVTGAAGRIGGVGGEVVEILRRRDLPVRALVRSEDERAEAFARPGPRSSSATSPARRTSCGPRGLPTHVLRHERVRALPGGDRHRRRGRPRAGDLEVFVNISQLTVSQMSLTAMTDSPQQRQHWLGEQALNWSGLPVVHVRPTVFLQHFFFSQWAAESIARDGTIRLPFGTARTSPVDTRDVAEVIAAVLEHPAAHVGKVYELTGPRSQDMRAMAAEYSEALGRTITYVDVPFEEWRDRELRRTRPAGVRRQAHADDGPAPCRQPLRSTHARRRGDHGRPATSIREYVAKHPEIFGSTRPAPALGS